MSAILLESLEHFEHSKSWTQNRATHLKGVLLVDLSDFVVDI